MLIKCAQIASLAHEGQYRKYSDNTVPYIVHPAQCVMLAKTLGEFSIDQLCALWLHDVIEDTGYTIDELHTNEVSMSIINMVIGLTNVYEKDSYPEFNRQKRHSLEKQRIAKLCHNVKAMKMIDRICNMMDIGIDNGFHTKYKYETNELFETCFENDDKLKSLYPKTYKLFVNTLSNY